MKTKSCVFILGMHRSGTSSLAGMLRQMGLFLGEVSEKNQFNEKGNQENPSINRMNNKLLQRDGGSWHHPVQIDTVSFYDTFQVNRIRRKLAGSGLPWGIKDPRMLFCLPAWYRPNDLLIGIFRHPFMVMKSLANRNKNSENPFSMDYWENLWCMYNRQLICLYKKKPFPIIDFNWNTTRYRAVVAAIAKQMGLNGTVEDFFDQSLIHFAQPQMESMQPETVRILHKLCDISRQEERKLLGSQDNERYVRR